MRTLIWSPSFKIPLCLACVLATGVVDSDAREQPAQGAGAELAKDGEGIRPYTLEIRDGTFMRGGKRTEATLVNVTEVLRELYPNANIVTSPELPHMTVPDLRLRASRLEETLDALTVATGEKVAWHRSGQRPGDLDPATGLPAKPGETALYVLVPGPGTFRGEGRRNVEVYNLTGYTHFLSENGEKEIGRRLEELKFIVTDTVVRLKKGMMPEGEPVDFQFHPGANLLIAIGPRDSLEVAHKVVMALPGVQTSATGEPVPPAAWAPGMGPDQQRERFMRQYPLAPPAAPAPAAAPTAPNPPR